MAAVALHSTQMSEFAGLPKWAAAPLLLESFQDTDEMSSLEMFAMVAAVAALGEQLGGERMMLRLDDNAAAGALSEASSKIQAILACIKLSGMHGAAVSSMFRCESGRCSLQEHASVQAARCGRGISLSTNGGAAAPGPGKQGETVVIAHFFCRLCVDGSWTHTSIYHVEVYCVLQFESGSCQTCRRESDGSRGRGFTVESKADAHGLCD